MLLPLGAAQDRTDPIKGRKAPPAVTHGLEAGTAGSTGKLGPTIVCPGAQTRYGTVKGHDGGDRLRTRRDRSAALIVGSNAAHDHLTARPKRSSFAINLVAGLGISQSNQSLRN